MRQFNTSGPCDPQKHYTLLRERLLLKGREKVDAGRYFTIFAPRQSGKTTYFQLLLQELQATYTPIWVSFESLAVVSKEVFYQDFTRQLRQELSKYKVTFDTLITDPVSLEEGFQRIQATKPLVLVIDEFEGVPERVLSELMHAFRRIYYRKEYSRLHTVILVGVSTVAELVVSTASPFNVVDELEIPYFTREEVHDLIEQYIAESGQAFDKEVINAIYDNTHGQPGLVCGLCAHLVENVVADVSKPVTMADWYATEKYFLTRRFDKNMINIVQKSREKPDLMLKILFNENPIPFSVYDPDIAYLFAHGVIHDVAGYVEIGVPLYRKVLITAFRPTINGEISQYVSAHETFQEYVTPIGLNLHALLTKYREYVRRHGFRAFDTEHLKEGAWHYSLDGFINFFIERLGGQTFLEVPAGRGRTDILIVYQAQKYLLETKIFTDQSYFQKGKAQLADYLTSEGLDEGYYAVFSNKHTEDDQLYFEEDIHGKRIYTYFICTHFDRPTDLPIPAELKK